MTVASFRDVAYNFDELYQGVSVLLTQPNQQMFWSGHIPLDPKVSSLLLSKTSLKL